MARITERLEVPVPATVAFDHLADFTTTASWDPSIVAARRLDAGDLGVGARFEVRLAIGPTTVPLVYTIRVHERPWRLVLVTEGPFHHGEDDVRFEPTSTGSALTWRASFGLRGPGRLVDPLLAVGFRRTGRAAVAGLDRSLSSLAPAT